MRVRAQIACKLDIINLQKDLFSRQQRLHEIVHIACAECVDSRNTSHK